MNVKVIKTEEDHLNALDRIADLMSADVNFQEEIELELLCVLVEKYESEQYPIHEPNLQDAVDFRIEQQGLYSFEPVETYSKQEMITRSGIDNNHRSIVVQLDVWGNGRLITIKDSTGQELTAILPDNMAVCKATIQA